MGTQPLAPARSALLAVCLLLAAAHLASAQSRVLVSQCVDIPSPINQQLCTVLNQDQCLDLSVNATLGSRVLISKAFSIADVAKSEQELTCQAIQGSSACKTCLSLTNVLVNHTIGALKGCLALQVKCLGATITSKKLGCFDVDNCSVPACPNGCSQHGSCTSTGCACNANYFGPDCSISAHNGCFSVGSMPETCINFQQENCTDMDVQVTVGGIKVVDRSLSLTDLANGLQLCADGDTLPCSPCFSIDEFSAGDGRYSACASSSVQCAGVQVGSFPVGCLSGNLSANCVPDVCPGGCSGHGSCSQLTCTCDAGYQGPDCSVYVNDKCVTIDGEIVCYAAQASCDGGLQIVASGDAEHVFQFAAADIGTPQCFDAFEDCSYCVTMTQFAVGLFDAAATTSLSLVCSGFTLNLPAQSYVAEQPASCFSATACATSLKDVTMRPGSPYSRIIARGTALNVLVKLQPKVADVTFTVTSDVPGMQAYSRAGCPASPGNYLHVRTVNQDPVSLWVSDCTTAKTIQGGSFYATLYCPMNVACLGSNSATCGSCNVSATAIVTVISPIGSAATASVDMGQQHFLSTGPLKEGDTFKVRVKVSSATEEQPAPPVLVGNNVCPTTDSFTYEFDFAANTEVDFELKGPCDDYLVALSGPAKGSITYEYARGAAASSKGTTVLIVLGCAVLAAAAAAFVYFKFMRKQNPGFVPLAMSEEEAAANDSVN